jgi:hypothetical protein
MSYLFDGVNDTLTGTFTSSYADPVTLACFSKFTDHPAANDMLVMLGNSASAINDSYSIKASNTDNVFAAVARDTTNDGPLSPVTNVDGVWCGNVGVFTSDTLRDIYTQIITNTQTNSVSKAVADVLKYIRVGEDLTAVQDFTGRIAEVAIWNKALTLLEVSAYLKGIKATFISPANLIGYWPLSASNATQANEGTDADGDLAVTGAVYDADHPIITGPPGSMTLAGIGGL